MLFRSPVKREHRHPIVRRAGSPQLLSWETGSKPANRAFERMARWYHFHAFYESRGRAEECAQMDETELRKHVLGAKKTERVVFAATPELKGALETVAQEKCASLSALLT